MNAYKSSVLETPRASLGSSGGSTGGSSGRFPWRQALLAAVAAVGLGGVAASYEEFWGADAPAGAAAPAMAPVPVSVERVESRSIPVWTAFSGRLEAVGRVEIRPRASGAIIAAHFREGSLVRQGDLLFTVDPAPYQAEVARLTAQVEAAGARVVLASRQQQRGFALGGANDLAKSEVDSRVNEYRGAEAGLRAANAALDTAKLNLGYTEVRAPISGRVGKIEVTQGNLVPAGSAAPVLTTLVSVDPIYASFEADENSVANALATLPAGAETSQVIDRIPVQMGTLATDGTPITGRLQLVDNLVDGSSGTVRVRAVFANHDGRLMPGQFARLRLGQANTVKAIAIDERAIGSDQDRRFVMVVASDNKVAPRQIELGAMADGLRIVTSGLQPGERIVVEGLPRIRPGALVAPTEMSAAELAGKSAAYASR